MNFAPSLAGSLFDTDRMAFGEILPSRATHRRHENHLRPRVPGHGYTQPQRLSEHAQIVAHPVEGPKRNVIIIWVFGYVICHSISLCMQLQGSCTSTLKTRDGKIVRVSVIERNASSNDRPMESRSDKSFQARRC